MESNANCNLCAYGASHTSPTFLPYAMLVLTLGVINVGLFMLPLAIRMYVDNPPKHGTARQVRHVEPLQCAMLAVSCCSLGRHGAYHSAIPQRRLSSASALLQQTLVRS